jgi:hypothetical protein
MTTEDQRWANWTAQGPQQDLAAALDAPHPVRVVWSRLQAWPPEDARWSDAYLQFHAIGVLYLLGFSIGSALLAQG